MVHRSVIHKAVKQFGIKIRCSYRRGVVHLLPPLNLALHCQMVRLYLLSECQILQPKNSPQSPHFSFAENGPQQLCLRPLFFLRSISDSLFYACTFPIPLLTFERIFAIIFYIQKKKEWADVQHRVLQHRRWHFGVVELP